MKFKEEYEDICKAGFVGSYEDYLEYRRGYGKEADGDYEPVASEKQSMAGEVNIQALAEALASNDYFVYRLIEELKKKGELR